jgi:hypothetical protein
MNKAVARTASHGTFVIERELPYPPAASRARADWSTISKGS